MDKIFPSLLQKYYTAFPKKDKFIQISPEAWVCNNFLSSEECNKYIEEAESIAGEGFGPKFSIVDLESLKKLSERLNDIIDGHDYSLDDFLHFKKNVPGHSMLPHIDVLGWQNRFFSEGLIPENSNIPKINYSYASYSTLLYFNDNYVGGEIDYPEYNVSYKPKAGDLVIHTVESVHAVRRLISGNRYACQSNINQKFTFDLNFINKFIIPHNNVFYGVNDDNDDFQYSIAAKKIINDRLRSWFESNPDISLYQNGKI